MKRWTVFILIFAMMFQMVGCKDAETDIEALSTPEATLQNTPIATAEAQESLNPSICPVQTEKVTAKPEETDNKKTEPPKTAEPKNICSLKVDCSVIFDNMDEFDEKKLILLPDDGIIYSSSEAEFKEGETVFDVLLRELKNNKIHFDYTSSAMGNNVYIVGINNIYEFDCGGMSGWVYSVNDEYPDCPCSQYVLSKGDRIEVAYTCDMGENMG